jgi:transcriptional regulator GlxA family with amidase domain
MKTHRRWPPDEEAIHGTPDERLVPVDPPPNRRRPVGDHSLDAMATRAGKSVRHLNRLFVGHVRITPARYVERVRVAAAKELLRRSSDPLATVASRSGFGSAETMRRTFRRAGHGTPGAHRHRNPPAPSGR